MLPFQRSIDGTVSSAALLGASDDLVETRQFPLDGEGLGHRTNHQITPVQQARQNSSAPPHTSARRQPQYGST